MALKTEKIDNCRYCVTSPRIKRWLKRDMHKLRRQSERRDIEDAMTKNRYRGWSI